MMQRSKGTNCIVRIGCIRVNKKKHIQKNNIQNQKQQRDKTGQETNK